MVSNGFSQKAIITTLRSQLQKIPVSRNTRATTILPVALQKNMQRFFQISKQHARIRKIISDAKVPK